jgi:signal transduction histidine kinase
VKSDVAANGPAILWLNLSRMTIIGAVMPRPRCRSPFFGWRARIAALLSIAAVFIGSPPALGTVLWSHPGSVFVADNYQSPDLLRGAIKPQDSNSSSTLYFRFRVDPTADAASKSIADFQSGFVFVEKGEEHLGIGSSLTAWAYCAWNVPKTVPKGFVDFNSATPVPPFRWEYIRSSMPKYIAFKVQFIPGHDAHITVWLNPDLALEATEINQPTNIVTQFEANATFDAIRLVFRGGNGTGWKYSEMVAGTTFEDLLARHFWQQTWFFVICAGALFALVVSAVQMRERGRSRIQFQQLEKERAVAMERARIAQDIHDEVGTSLTKISRLSEGMDLDPGNGAANAGLRQAIAVTARDTIRAMDEIVWAINPRNDTLKEMADYLVYFATDLLGSARIACKLEVPLTLPDLAVAAEVRHAVAMVVKEALNNAVKHAAPRGIRVGLEVGKAGISVVVADDGRGFNFDQASGVGNGLENMQKRMRAIGGTVEFVTQPGQGTSVRLLIPNEEVKANVKARIHL